MKKTLLVTFLLMSSFAHAGESQFKNFNQALIQNLHNDVNEISRFIKKKDVKKVERLPASELSDVRKLRFTMQDTTRLIVDKPRVFERSKVSTYEIDQIRNFDYKNYYVNGLSSF